MRIFNFIMGVIWKTMMGGTMIFTALFGAGYILEEVVYSDEFFAVLIIPYAIYVTTTVVKWGIIEISALSNMYLKKQS